MARNELKTLVDEPREVQDVEYKSWLDLSEPGHRADFARHVAAIANYGGGHIVFGFEPKGLAPCATDAAKLAKINHDIIAGLIDSYLTPSFHCDVTIVESAAGNLHPIVTVPGHGATPVCAKRNGPDTNGQPQGIVSGSYYIRKPGPKSEAIRTPEEWAPLIRRCAMHERSNIVGALSAALRSAPEQPASDLLADWHSAADAAFLSETVAHPNAELLKRARQQFSYRVITEDSERLATNRLERVISEVNNEVRDLVTTGWSMFYPFNGKLRWNADDALGDDDFLELGMFEGITIANPADFWRISPLGLVTLVRDYWEDSGFIEERYGLKPGTVIDPAHIVRALAELVRHARGMAERFESASAVEFRCQWRGLTGRQPCVVAGYRSRVGHPTQREERTLVGTYPLGDLGTQWPEVVADLASPLARTLGIEEMTTPSAIRNWASRFNNF
jgi:hypothetical protein